MMSVQSIGVVLPGDNDFHREFSDLELLGISQICAMQLDQGISCRFEAPVTEHALSIQRIDNRQSEELPPEKNPR